MRNSDLLASSPSSKLIQNSVALQDEVAKYNKICEESYVAAKKETAIQNRLWLDSPWNDFFGKRDPMVLPSTGLDEETLKHICTMVSTEPGDGFTLHSGLYFLSLIPFHSLLFGVYWS